MSKSHLLVILQAENGASVTSEDSLVLLQRLEKAIVGTFRINWWKVDFEKTCHVLIPVCPTF